MLMKQWGRYPWSDLYGIDKIHCDDFDNFQKQMNNCKVFECIDENPDFITLKYGDSLFRVKGDLFKVVPSPKFHIGQSVVIKNKEKVVVISDIMWHLDQQEHYYFVTVDGKKKSKRYFENEFEN